jgi:sialidase-1
MMSNQKTFIVCVLFSFIAAMMCSFNLCNAGEFESIDVYVHGTDGYHTYRIPSLLVTTKGTLLAFCEGRRISRSDTGDIDMLVKRSEDGGKTWGKQQVIWDDGENTCGNPCPVVDQATGVIWLLMTWNLGPDREDAIIMQKSRDNRRVYICHSDDDGLTWSKPEDITAATKKPEWTWYATGPGVGIQLQHGARTGRLVIPCDNSLAGEPRKYQSHVIYSDDHGATWRVGGTVPDLHVNECQIVELHDGRLMLNMRNYLYKGNDDKMRAVSYSSDQGITWSKPLRDPELPEPICQASLITYCEKVGEKPILLFSNPARNDRRTTMTVKASFDEGDTWPKSMVLYDGPAAYSCLAVLNDGLIGCLYEAGTKNPYEKITLTLFPITTLKEK